MNLNSAIFRLTTIGVCVLATSVASAGDVFDRHSLAELKAAAKESQPIAELTGGEALFVNIHANELLDDTLFDDSSPLAAHAQHVLPRGRAGWQEGGLGAIRGVTIGPIESSQQPGRGYGTPYTEALLDELVRMGVTWVSITPFGRIWSLESTDITMDFEAPYEVPEDYLEKAKRPVARHRMRVAGKCLWSFDALEWQAQEQFDGRVDHILNRGQRVFVRYSFLRDDSAPATPLPDGSGNFSALRVPCCVIATLSFSMKPQPVSIPQPRS